MAYTTNYALLVEELQDIVDDTNAEFVANLPKIINRALDVVQRDLGLAIWRRFTSLNISSGVVSYNRPNGALQIFSIFVPSEGRMIEQRHLDWVRTYGTATGVPRYWAEVDEGAIRIAPVPDRAYVADIEVLKKLPALDLSSQTNWITDNAADLLLLASLIGCEVYLVGPGRVQEFTALYQMILQSAVNELRGSERTRYTPVRAAARPTLNPGTSA